jgi:tol-pal system protein YbgF
MDFFSSSESTPPRGRRWAASKAALRHGFLTPADAPSYDPVMVLSLRAWSSVAGSLLLLAGCAGTATPAAAGIERERAELLRENGALRSRVERLESRLSALSAENEALERALRGGGAVEASTEERAIDDELAIDEGLALRGEEPEVEERGEDPRGERPMLRLSGPGPSERPALAAASALAGPAAPPVVAPPPDGSLGRLIVTGGPDDVPAIPAAPITVAPHETAPDPAASEYQEALRLLSERDVERALRALAAFVARHPEHPYADNALYFRGEVLYAQRAYREAIRELELLVARYPEGGRVADALLRIGTCWERLGDSARAATYFERVRSEHPDSAAARMADREDT